MDIIELRGLTWYGHHGAFAEEQRLGQRFIVDLRLAVDLALAGRSDDLALTVDYGRVADAARGIVEGPPFKLIEALAEAIAGAILDGFALVQRVEVRVAKPSAPVAVMSSGLIAVEISRARVGAALAEPCASHAASPERTSAPAGVLTAAAIRELQQCDPPLSEPLLDPAGQIQPNGLDVTLESVWRLAGPGAIGLTNAARVLPDRVAIDPEEDGFFVLSPGTYIIRFQEVVALPLDVMAFGRPRSSVLRGGAAIHTAVWDAGYRGRSEALLVVYAQEGIRLARGARVMQLVFCRLEAPTVAYDGAYQGEYVSNGRQNVQTVTNVAGSQ